MHRLCDLCEWLPSLLAIMVANSFLSLLKQTHMLNRDKSANLTWFWSRPTNSVLVKEYIFFHQALDFFCEYRVFLLYAHGYLINAQCIYIYISYINVHLRLSAFDFATLISAQILFINYLFWSKSLWIEVAWNAYWKTQSKLWWTLKTGEETFTVKSALSIKKFQSMQFLNTFVRLVNVHGCMWRVSTGVLSFDDNRKIRICRFESLCHDSYQYLPIGTMILQSQPDQVYHR